MSYKKTPAKQSKKKNRVLAKKKKSEVDSANASGTQALNKRFKTRTH